MLNKQKGVLKTLRDRLYSALLNVNEKGRTAVEKHWMVEKKKPAELNQPVYFKDALTSE